VGEPMKQNALVPDSLYSADGQRILSWGYGTAQLWNASDGKVVGEPMQHAKDVRELCLATMGSAS